MTPEQRWKTEDLDDEMIVDVIWDSWTKLFHTAQFLFSEQQISQSTYDDMIQCLLDVKPALCKYMKEK